MIEVNINSIPAEMRQEKRWVLWRKEDNKKVPCGKNGYKINAYDPTNWLSFEDALEALSTGGGDGVGFVLGDGFAGIDLDDCLDEGGNPKQWAKGLIRLLSPTYCEVSPSGKGVKLFFKTDANINKRKGGVEIYTSGRYFTVTGQKLEYVPVPSTLTTVDGEILQKISQKLDIIDLAIQINNSKHGEDLQALFEGNWQGYPSQSEGDLAFVSKVINRCGVDNPEDLDFLFRLSGLYRKKCDDPHSSDGCRMSK